MANLWRGLFGGAALLACLAGCSETSRLEKEYANLSKVGSTRLKCQTATDLAELWARKGNMAKAGEWSRTADLDCAVAQLQRV